MTHYTHATAALAPPKMRSERPEHFTHGVFAGALHELVLLLFLVAWLPGFLAEKNLQGSRHTDRRMEQARSVPALPVREPAPSHATSHRSVSSAVPRSGMTKI